MNRVYNFGAGPAILPVSVLEEAAKGVLEIGGTGMSVLEISHRSKAYEAIHVDARERILRLLGLSPEEYVVLFVQGGASTQFAMVPLNFMRQGATADYVVGGDWGAKALKEAVKVGRGVPQEAASSKSAGYGFIPKEYSVTLGARYVHVTTNNTIEGTQWFGTPFTDDHPLIADMSSDFLSVQRDYSKYALMYAGAQKNAGPAGVAVVVANRKFLETAAVDLPAMLAYKTFVDSDSLYNTPPCFTIYVVGLVAKWLEELGGLSAIEKANRDKAAVLYAALDELDSFYKPIVTAKEDRSLMNVTFKLQPEYSELEKPFLAGAKERKLEGLAGHRSVGGFRASIYNAFPAEGVQALADYMREFAKANG
jgi:phosphoserine aminotransferase